MSFKIYPKLPTAPENSSEQDKLNTNTINSELHELLQLKDKFNTKYNKYNKVIERLMLLNASSSALTIGSSVSSIATAATIVDIPVSAGLGGVALAGSISVGLIRALVKKYQKKLNKVMKLYNIATSATAVFETSILQALNDGKIDLKEFQLLQGTYYKALEKLSSTDREMAVETRGQFEKSLLEELQSIKCFIMCACILFAYFMCYSKNYHS